MRSWRSSVCIALFFFLLAFIAFCVVLLLGMTLRLRDPLDAGDGVCAFADRRFAVMAGFRRAHYDAVCRSHCDRTAAADGCGQAGDHLWIAAQPDADQTVILAVCDQGICVTG